MRRQRQQHLVHQHNVLKVVNHRLAVQKVQRRRQPVPAQALARPQLQRAGGDARDGDDLVEGHDLDGGDDDDDVQVAHEEGREEAADHDEGPERAGEEVCLLLFVLCGGGWGFLGGCLLGLLLEAWFKKLGRS